ncbi:hypothetical protein SAMN06295964_2926 [Aeromicrobium choanae]|uniref:PKD domain-containing protein n=1 Tax=Aeromicrobium choanae TaxID=1736691 RepID=A0A1T4Z761_9ACTN|nr:hypothetical protein SAMN06295964_2926 [Aeromicrobium choanae]
MIAILTALILAAPSGDVEVIPNPTSPEVRLENVRRSPPEGPAPIRVRNPGAPEPAPIEQETDPLYCRPEAPFPQEECIPFPEPAEPTEAPEREVTPGDVVEAVERVGLPRLRVAVQPAGSTLVNLDTIFHTSSAPFEETVDILDSTVDLRATPASYSWHHGDGTAQTTTSPGRPYPALDVIHRYRRPGGVSARVDVTYRVTYRVDGGAWQELDSTITATGPATPLRVREARPVLTR